MTAVANNKRIVIIAGPNGAGKTTFAHENLSTGVELFLGNLRGWLK